MSHRIVSVSRFSPMNAQMSPGDGMSTRPKRSWRNERAIGLAALIFVTGCAVTGSSSIPKIAFEVQTGSGTVLEVKVRSYGIYLTDAELKTLVSGAMESVIWRQNEGRPVLSVSGEAAASMTWQVTGEPGRPAKTFVGVELIAGDKKDHAYALICGPNDSQVRGELIRTISMLTSRLLKGTG